MQSFIDFLENEKNEFTQLSLNLTIKKERKCDSKINDLRIIYN